LLEQAVAEVEARQLLWQHVTALRALVLGQREAGRLEDALATAGRALRLARERAQRGEEAALLRARGEIRLDMESGDLEVALADVREALALARQLGLRPLASRCHFDCARLLRRLGQSAQAAGHLSEALAGFRDLAMTEWQRRAEAESGR
jgi:tetratricopeptide (TPR) repeat protein